ncbi:hypothetical protein EXN66_Car003214 [Channa argus]|uniref:Uncharacterized protein n=1 Tax=Channa argus TaxID=215402 RepID=A0A6G1PBC7_CHAAH|nr:hypothetical protein EXN66_Car003214 [Channa argus]
MYFAACAISLLCMVCVSHSAPLPCEELVRPLKEVDFHNFKGLWAMVAGSLSYLTNLEKFKQRDSATVNFYSNTSDTSVSYSRSIRLDNKCLYTSYNISLQGGSFTYDGTDKNNVSAIFVRPPCHDCMVMHIQLKSKEQQHFYLFSRRRQLEQKEMEEFSAQVQCLHMPSPVVLDPTKELCADETADDPTAQPEQKTEEQKK